MVRLLAGDVHGEEPLAQTTNIGRHVTAVVHNMCLGDRYDNGENLFRLSKVISPAFAHGHGSGVRLSAEVGSGEPLRCQTPRQRYYAWIHILPYTASSMHVDKPAGSLP